MESQQTTDIFGDIRSIRDIEVPETIHSLLADEKFKKAVIPLIRPLSWEQFYRVMGGCRTIEDFQRNVVYPVVTQLIKKTTNSLNGENWSNLRDNKSHVIISNHRDIVLDAALLNILMVDQGMGTTEIAIGDNLLIYPWISKLVRLNKSFIVKRGVSIRQMLQASKHLSDYIHHTVTERDQSVWIAQREGRAKDSDDKTQISLLKMLSLRDSSHVIKTLTNLHVVPLSISYEYDPCDYLKAKEFQLKRDNPEHKKSQSDDLENMITGIWGYKGSVYFRFGEGIDKKLDKLDTLMDKAKLLEKAATMIDIEIYKNYVFFPCNYIAYDMMTHSDRFAIKYTEEDKMKFEKYLNTQIGRITIRNKDPEFLRRRMVEMYANTLKNYLSVKNNT